MRKKQGEWSVTGDVSTSVCNKPCHHFFLINSSKMKVELKTFFSNFYEYFLLKKFFISSTAEKYAASIPKIARSSRKSGGRNSKNVPSGE